MCPSLTRVRVDCASGVEAHRPLTFIFPSSPTSGTPEPTVVATDMRSTNGTVVQMPGAAPRTLIRGESAVLVPGTRIDLGEGAVLDILARHTGDES